MNAALKNLIQNEPASKLRDWLALNPTVEVAEELSHLDSGDQALAFRLLRKDKAMAVFEALDTEHQRTLLEGLREERVRELVEALPADDRARLFDEMPAKVVARIQQGLSREERDATARLLGYPAGSAGRVMLPVVTTVSAEQTREEALARLSGQSERGGELAVLPVTDGSRRLLGTVSLADLVTAERGAVLSDLFTEDTYSVSAYEDQEAAARLIQEADLLALPVLDNENRLLGMITVDDAMEILESEATEDAYRSGGAEPIRRPYMAVTVFGLARSRAVWLLLLIVAAVLTVNVLEFFEDTLESMVVLALFIPLLIDTGGNAGSQAASAMIRALAVGEVRFADLPRILWREARVGVLLGAMLAAVGFPVASIFYGTDIGLIIALTLLFICLWASAIGGILPLVASKLRIDPAVFSAPVITTVADATGLIIYFLIATAVLSDDLAMALPMIGG
ncbi:magnesium transporter [Bogoriella caseilytica]|uniref:Magnesium transporter MgtE n=1 Tax=Bogoriella caseilytica TaxID=56055 RepID=A0A3N2BCC2_9MICO|nr:magnesium transporter [Bogoriella caseilytica]ROR72899.1 Mg2+ transporter MgtE [Bogoriella caseilytica]